MNNCYNMLTESIASLDAGKIDDRKKELLEAYCYCLDNIAEEFDGSICSVNINTDSGMPVIALSSQAITIRYYLHTFCQLIDCSVTVSFSYIDDDTIGMVFVFPSIWRNGS